MKRALASVAFPLAVILVAALLFGCRAGGTTASGTTRAPAAESAPRLSVTVVEAKRVPMRQVVTLLGVTAALKHVMVRAPAAGRVIGLRLQSGDTVRRGEIVAHVINRELEAAESGLRIAGQLDPQDAPALAASVNRYAHGAGIPVKSPEDAVVAQRLVSSGQIVNYLDPMVDLIDPRSLYVDAAVPIDELSLIRPGMPAAVTSPIDPGMKYPARVAALSPSFSANGATTPARLEFTTARRIDEAGAAVEVRIVTKSVPEALAIPDAALFQDPGVGGYHVFVFGADGRAHRTPVTIGIRSGPLVQVLSGLKPADAVITSGGYALADGLQVTVAAGR